MSSVETFQQVDPFANQLGDVLMELAEQMPDPDDETAMRFIGTDADGTTGFSSCSPRQFAEEVLQGTPQGLHTVEFYRKISENLGDPTGQRVIDDMREHLLTQE